ncbi:778_t:CDS:1, partial [Scutellospora calospora]
TETYIKRINEAASSLKPNYDPITPKPDKYDSESWLNYNREMQDKITQEMINLNWIEFYNNMSRYITH